MASGLVRAGRPVVVPTPTASDQATTMAYVDAGDALAVPLTSVGAANGVAPLDANGRIITTDLPPVLSPRGAVTDAGGTQTSFSSAANIWEFQATNDLIIPVPSSGTSGQVLRGRVYAEAADRTVTFASGWRKTTGLTLGPHTVPDGEVFIFAVEYFFNVAWSVNIWMLTAYTTTEP